MGDEPSLGEVARTCDRIEKRLDLVVLDMELRLRRVEKWMYAIPPTLLVSAASVTASIILALRR